MAERTDDSSCNRSLDKDAFDVYRLLRAVGTAELAAEARRLLEDEISSAATAQALSLFHDLFGGAEAIGTRWIVQHVAGLEDPDFIAASSVSLSREFLDSAS